MPPTDNPCHVDVPRVVDQVESTVDHAEVLRYLGYPAGKAPARHLRKALVHWVEQARQRATPRAAFVVLPVTHIDQRCLRLQSRQGTCEFHGAIGEFLGPCESVAVFVATAGPNVEQLASELMAERDELAAMIVNAVGAERAEAAESAVLRELRTLVAPLGLAPTLPYSPGYCGMQLAEQRTLFDLFGGETAGVTLSDAYLMKPLKSVSGLIGLGPAREVALQGSPCDRCELYSCAMRR